MSRCIFKSFFMFGVIWPFMTYRDLNAQSSRFRGILLFLDFFQVILVDLELRGYFGQL